MEMSLGKLEPVNREAAASIIAEQLRNRIIDGTFSSGTQLREAQLADRFKVSRGPVREALQRLIQEGLLQNEQNRGVSVISLDNEDIIDIYFSRRAIEQAATLTLIRCQSTEALDPLERIIDQMSVAAETADWASVADLDLRFHESLVQASGSKRLNRMFSTLLVETRICLAALESAYPIHTDIVDEHRNLLRVVCMGQESEALELVDVHMKSAVGHLINKSGLHRSL